MISGYFLIGKVNFNIVRLESVWLRTFFYSAIIYLFAFCFLRDSLYIKTFFSMFYNGFHGVGLWFVNYYIGMILLSPFLSMFVKGITQRTYLFLLVILSFLNISVSVKFGTAFANPNLGFSLQYFVFLFMVGGYIRLYNPLSSVRINIYGILLFFVLQIALHVTRSFVHEFGNIHMVTFPYNGSAFFLSLFLFLFFKNYTFNHRFWGYIQRIAPYTFAVYLISDNVLMRNLLWHGSFQPKDYINSFLFIPLMVCIGFCIFIVGILADYLRLHIVRLVNGGRLLDAFNNRVEKFCVPYIKRKLI